MQMSKSIYRDASCFGTKKKKKEGKKAKSINAHRKSSNSWKKFQLQEK